MPSSIGTCGLCHIRIAIQSVTDYEKPFSVAINTTKTATSSGCISKVVSRNFFYKEVSLTIIYILYSTIISFLFSIEKQSSAMG